MMAGKEIMDHFDPAAKDHDFVIWNELAEAKFTVVVRGAEKKEGDTK